MLVEGRLPPVVALAASLVLLLVGLALALGMPGPVTRWIALGTLALGWFYTAPPLSLNHRGLGEVTVAAVLDLLVPLLAYGLARGQPSGPGVILAVCVPLCAVQAARMLVMNLSDHEGDRRAGKRTLAVKLGPGRTRCAFVVAQVAAYAAVVGLVAARALPPAVGFAMLLTAPLGAWLGRRLLDGAPRDPREAEAMALWASTHAALLAAAATFGLLVSAPPAADALSLALPGGVLGVYAAIAAAQIPRSGEGEGG